MPFVNAPQTTEALTGNGDAAGYVTVTSNANYYPGAFVWLKSATQSPKRYVITDLKGTDKIGLREALEPDETDLFRKIPPTQYGRTPVTQWLTADTAQINQMPSTVRVELSNITKLPLIP